MKSLKHPISLGILSAIALALALSGCNQEQAGPEKIEEKATAKTATVETKRIDTIPSKESLIPYDSRWEYALTLGFRPANHLPTKVNPPRFSWRYEKDFGTPERRDADLPLQTFRFQIASDSSFSKPEVDVTTRINFYNALSPLAHGKWYWRVAYDGSEARPAVWSETRDFIIDASSLSWDRTGINEAAARVAKIPHPRFGPAGGNWQGLYKQISSDPLLRKLGFTLLENANEATATDWWTGGLPETDNLGNPRALNRNVRLQFNTMAKGIANAAFAWKLTGDEKYAKAKELLIDFTKYEIGGLSSPEWHGNPHKFGTEIVKYLALAYDWLYQDLSAAEREKVSDSIAWRIEAIYLGGKSWADDGMIDPLGMAMKNGSHPYQNSMWSVPAILAITGDQVIADQVLPIVLQYMAGVSASQGPEGAYNEGHAYGTEKGGVYLDALVYLQMLAPELEMGKNPQLRGLGDWYGQVLSLSSTRLPWGDQWGNMIRQQLAQVYHAYKLAWITGEARYVARAEGLQQWRFHGPRIPVYQEAFLPLLAFNRLALPEGDLSQEKSSQIFPVSGWMFAGSHAPSDASNFKNSIQLQMQARPMGRSSHSYGADGTFVWNAFGRTISAGGDKTKFLNPYCRATDSHNGLLINGKGQDYQYNQHYVEPDQPAVMAHPLAWEEGENYLYWAVDITPTYFKHPEIQRVVRHVVMVDEKFFVIYDDLKAELTEGPNKASFLFKAHDQVPVALADNSFSYTVEDIQAKVVFANSPESIEIQNLAGRDGYINPVSGKDWGPEVNEQMQRLARGSQKGNMDPNADYLKDIPVWNNLWVNQPLDENGEAHFLSALLAWKGENPPAVEVLSEQAMKLSWGDGSEYSISFDPAIDADLVINPETARTRE